MPQSRINLSVPADLLDRLIARANAEHRSVSNLAAHLLRQAMEPSQIVVAAPARRSVELTTDADKFLGIER